MIPGRLRRVEDADDNPSPPDPICFPGSSSPAREGDEVVQLYIHRPVASVTQPVLELKRFQRVGLQPGERRTVDFELTPADFAFWNLEMKDVNEPGPVVVSSGSNSVELKSANLEITAPGAR